MYKYYEEDKEMTKKIMGEEEIYEQICPSCKGKPVQGHVCTNCEGQGFYEVEVNQI